MVRDVLNKLGKECGYENFVELSGKKYHVGCMSYNEYFIEKYSPNRTERDPFPECALWENSDFAEVLQLLIDNNYIKIK
jgi:hypothetical protein